MHKKTISTAVSMRGQTSSSVSSGFCYWDSTDYMKGMVGTTNQVCIWHSKLCKYTLCGMPFPVHPILLPWSISCAPDAASYTLESIVECVGCPHSNVLAVAIECMISYQLFTLRYTFMSWCIGHAFYKHCIAAKLHAHVTLTTLGALMKNIDPSMKLYVFDRNGHKKCL